MFDILKENVLGEHEVDNGGANAIKGFNFQKASIVLVAILNYQKEGFSIIPEATDDFEVKIKNMTFFVQVKSSPLNQNKITKSSEKGKHIMSILEKNISPGGKNTMYCIFTPYDKFSGKDTLSINRNHEICNPVYSFYENIYGEILIKVDSDILSADEIKDKLKRFSIYETPFPDDYEIAISTLTGLMSKHDILVDEYRGISAIKEISHSIDIVSEKKINPESLEEKTITQIYLDNIFKTNTLCELFNEFLTKMLSVNTLNRNKIRKHRLTIEPLYSETKREIKRNLYLADIDLDLNEDDLVASAEKIISDKVIACEIKDKYLLIAIVIEILIEMEAK